MTQEFLEIGYTTKLQRSMNHNKIGLFGTMAEDHNPIHFHKDAALGAGHQDRLVPGFLITSFFSGMLANFPGGQTELMNVEAIRFLAPTYINEVVDFRIVITDIFPKTVKGFAVVCYTATAHVGQRLVQELKGAVKVPLAVVTCLVA